MNLISFVIPCFNEEQNISLIVSRIENTAKTFEEYDYEIILVDDNSQDNTYRVILEISKEKPKVHYIKLAKNVGSHLAIASGLSILKSDLAIILAADCQDPPELSKQLIEYWEKGYKIVWGARRNYKRSFIGNIFSSFYYWYMKKYSNVNMPPGGADMVLLDKTIIDIYNTIEEKNTSIWAIISWLGFEQATVYYDKSERKFGQSSWTFSKKLKAAIDSFVSFSHSPIHFISIIGLITSGISFFAALIYLLNQITGGYILGEIVVPGWAGIITLMLFISGIQILMLGIIGEYIWRLMDQVRNRPSFIIEDSSTKTDKKINSND